MTRIDPALGGRAEVDVHFSISEIPAPDAEVWRALSANTDRLRIGDLDVTVLSRAGIAMHIVLHFVQHGARMHTGEDLSRAISSATHEEWGAAVDLADELGALEVMAAGLRMHAAGPELADRLGLPDPVLSTSAADLRFGPLGAWSLAVFLAAPTLRDKVTWIVNKVVPRSASVRATYQVPTGRRIALVVGYVRWWMGLAAKAAPAVRYVRSHRTAVSALKTRRQSDRGGGPGGS